MFKVRKKMSNENPRLYDTSTTLQHVENSIRQFLARQGLLSCQEHDCGMAYVMQSQKICYVYVNDWETKKL